MIPGFFVHMNTRAEFSETITQTFTPKHTRRMCLCVCSRALCVLVLLLKGRAAAERVSLWAPYIRVQIRETSKQVLMQRCGLTSECLYVGEDLLKALVFLARRAR